MDSYFSLILGSEEAQEEIFLRYHYGFNPYAHIPEPRVVKQQMMEGVSYQDSGCHWGDGEIAISGVGMDRVTFGKLNSYYLQSGERLPFIFCSYLQTPPEQWRVLWKTFRVEPVEVKPESKLSWSLELFVLGRLLPDGTVAS